MPSKLRCWQKVLSTGAHLHKDYGYMLCFWGMYPFLASAQQPPKKDYQGIGSSAKGKVIRKPAQTAERKCTAVLHPYPEFRSPKPTSTVSWSHKTGGFYMSPGHNMLQNQLG